MLFRMISKFKRHIPQEIFEIFAVVTFNMTPHLNQPSLNFHWLQTLFKNSPFLRWLVQLKINKLYQMYNTFMHIQ